MLLAEMFSKRVAYNGDIVKVDKNVPYPNRLTGLTHGPSTGIGLRGYLPVQMGVG